jgi:hypothetical protein
MSDNVIAERKDPATFRWQGFVFTGYECAGDTFRIGLTDSTFRIDGNGVG